jgi:hypothetical protein
MSKTPRRILVLAALAALALTAAGPAGAQLLFDARLDGFQEVPGVDSDAYGHCTGILKGFDFADPEAGDPVFEIACTHNLAAAVAAHIHRGFPDVAGPIVFPFGDPAAIAATWDLSVEEAIRLIAGGYYVNVHSPAHPAGEIRGQLLPDQPVAEGLEIMGFPLTGGQEVPAVDTEAEGACFALIELGPTVIPGSEQGEVDLFCAHSVVSPTAAHIHEQVRGIAGPIVVPFPDPTSPIIVQDIAFDDALATPLRSGDLYVNVHTAAHPPGEIRGQMDSCASSTEVLCLEEDRFSVQVRFSTTQAGGLSGDAVPVRETGNSGMFWFFDPANLEMLIKVLDGCLVNDRYWVFLSATTNVGFTVTVTDEHTGESANYDNPDLTEAEPQLDTDALDVCP